MNIFRDFTEEEYARTIRKKALIEYVDHVESECKKEWNDALNRWKETQGDNKC